MGARIVTVDFEVDGAKSDAEAEAFVRARLRAAPGGPFGPCAFAGCTVRNKGGVIITPQMIAVRDFIQRMPDKRATNGELRDHFGCLRPWSRAIRALERRGIVARPTCIDRKLYEIDWRFLDPSCPRTEYNVARAIEWRALPWELVG